MKKTTLLVGILCAASLSSCQKEKSKPNVIYILMDDMGYGDLQCYGQEKIETPNIDRLKDNGIKLTQHYSGSPVSAPSRCVLTTGLNWMKEQTPTTRPATKNSLRMNMQTILFLMK